MKRSSTTFFRAISVLFAILLFSLLANFGTGASISSNRNKREIGSASTSIKYLQSSMSENTVIRNSQIAANLVSVQNDCAGISALVGPLRIFTKVQGNKENRVTRTYKNNADSALIRTYVDFIINATATNAFAAALLEHNTSGLNSLVDTYSTLFDLLTSLTGRIIEIHSNNPWYLASQIFFVSSMTNKAEFFENWNTIKPFNTSLSFMNETLDAARHRMEQNSNLNLFYPFSLVSRFTSDMPFDSLANFLDEKIRAGGLSSFSSGAFTSPIYFKNVKSYIHGYIVERFDGYKLNMQGESRYIRKNNCNFKKGKTFANNGNEELELLCFWAIVS